jgi:hypothetical protein
MNEYAPLAKPIIEPQAWLNDNGARREPVIDHNDQPPRVVRLVGWRKCISCVKFFFSRDVCGIRICDCCKGYKRA